MFVKYRIMKYLKFDKYETLEAVFKKLNFKDLDSFGQAVDQLGKDGFVDFDDSKKISLRTYSSFSEYKAYLRKSFFEVCVSLSAIIMAITSIVSVYLQYRALLL